MADESDGISEAFEGQLRVAVTAAGRVGEIIARQHEEAARRAQAASMQEAHELTSRMNVERQSARTEYGQVYRSEWWDKATPQDIGSMLATARAWVHEDPEAVRAETRMSDELRTRYGVDVDQAGGDPQAVQAAVDAEVQQRAAGRGERRPTLLSSRAASRPATTPVRSWSRSPRPSAPLATPRYRADFGNEGSEKSADEAQAQQAAGAANDARSELRSRYGIDLSETAGDYDGTRAAVDAELLRLNGDTERQRSRTEESEAALLMRQADEADRRAKAANARADNAPEGSENAHKPARKHAATRRRPSLPADYGPKYDSAERRENDANKLEAKGLEKEAVSAKMHADLGNAKPATEAVKSVPLVAAKARTARSAASRVQRMSWDARPSHSGGQAPEPSQMLQRELRTSL